MFTDRDEYMEATRDASINSYDDEDIGLINNNGKTIVFGLLIATTLTVMGYLGINYINMDQKIDFNQESELLTILDNLEVDTIEVDPEEKSGLSCAMSDIVDESPTEDSSAYVKSLSKEIDRAGNS